MNIRVTPFIERIRELEFVKSVQYAELPEDRDAGIDGVLKVKTPRGTFGFAVLQKNSYLDRTVLNAFLVQAKYRARKQDPQLLFARYLPRPTAERLIDAGVNFVDRAGNMHLVLGTQYARTAIGNREIGRIRDERALTPGKIQLLFALAANEEASGWPVRQLAEEAGLSKSNVAKLRNQLVQEGILQKSGEMRHSVEVEEYLVRGYEQILRPRLLVGRFRSPEANTDEAFKKIKLTLDDLSLRWSLTGGRAAYLLQQFYKGPELGLFLSSPAEQTVRKLRLLPDAHGPILLFRSFGTPSYWKRVEGIEVAHPWLIYSELIRSDDPRAHEAATELKREFLPSWSN